MTVINYSQQTHLLYMDDSWISLGLFWKSLCNTRTTFIRLWNSFCNVFKNCVFVFCFVTAFDLNSLWTKPYRFVVNTMEEEFLPLLITFTWRAWYIHYLLTTGKEGVWWMQFVTPENVSVSIYKKNLNF